MAFRHVPCDFFCPIYHMINLFSRLFFTCRANDLNLHTWALVRNGRMHVKLNPLGWSVRSEVGNCFSAAHPDTPRCAIFAGPIYVRVYNVSRRDRSRALVVLLCPHHCALRHWDTRRTVPHLSVRTHVLVLDAWGCLISPCARINASSHEHAGLRHDERANKTPLTWRTDKNAV